MDEVQATHTQMHTHKHTHIWKHMYTHSIQIYRHKHEMFTHKNTHTHTICVSGKWQRPVWQKATWQNTSVVPWRMTRQVRKEEGEEEEKMTTKKEMFTVKENEAIERENFRSGREERPIRSKENSRKGYVGVKRLCYRCVCVWKRECVFRISVSVS